MPPLRYHPYYCEENVWWLAREPSLRHHRRWAVFVTNQQKACALWCQMAGDKDADGLVIWDYHVILVTQTGDAPAVWDLDSTLGYPVALASYLEATFRPLEPRAAALAPLFRVIDAEQFLTSFATDRSHMRTADGGWLQPPPPWAPPGLGASGGNLPSFLDPTSREYGEVMDLAGLRQRFGIIQSPSG